MKSFECAQSNIVNIIMGFNKRSHYSNLLHADRIDKVETSVIRGILALWYRIYQVDNPARVLSNAMLCDICYINSRHLIPSTLIHRVVEEGFSPMKCLSIMQQFTAHRANNIQDGIVDSLRHLVYHENFVNLTLKSISWRPFWLKPYKIGLFTLRIYSCCCQQHDLILYFLIITYRVICPVLCFLCFYEYCSVLIVLLLLLCYVDIIHILDMYFPILGVFMK